MILLALGGLCVSVGVRTQQELLQAHHSQLAVQQQLNIKQIEIQKLNRDIQDLSSNPVSIEHAARKMGMVKQNEVVVILPDAPCTHP
jgi:cell division protein FtsB